MTLQTHTHAADRHQSSCSHHPCKIIKVLNFFLFWSFFVYFFPLTIIVCPFPYPLVIVFPEKTHREIARKRSVLCLYIEPGNSRLRVNVVG
ncbi:hypothetical protein VTJ04DRAFT_1085 [Mycothermus thermophilus]|uniref:uncharacterized protein n=1 Tax=Humicola insolens TaxID=85995 RepID=UPI003744AF04